MDIKQLHYFIAVSEQMNFSKAAERLHISQPSLSNAIKKLEQEIGSPLLERNTRNLQLTEAGELLFERAKVIVKNMEVLKIEMDEVIVHGTRDITIGVMESIKHWLPKVIANYKKDYPHMKIHLVDILGSKRVKKSLKSYKTHLIITNQLMDDPELEVQTLYEERLVAVLPLHHPLAQKDTLTISDICEEPFIISTEGFQTRRDILTSFEQAGKNINIQFEIERFETAVSLVREHLGVTILPENYLQGPTAKTIVKKEIEGLNLSRNVYLVYLKNRHLPLAIRQLLKDIVQFFENK
ncbi:LysR family transcriptional regulator [Lysinibacillus capsici]|uniref:HTH-type transcriptional regulator GltC n=2 Tax=Lysinibacillus capsici TaxID=2115968 RepID=A0A2X1AK15_9BACI|nr:MULTISPECIES: LysR family transcriptional regulator [Lysinibacillus]MBX8943723.1 LysR family transcriptional regulator [Lysinibacillus sp. K60]MCM0624136.1 LysR family transcriptional regulator [Lysinibacillus sp. OL1_EC]KMN40242.1 LysR family transcriptional regulator [Lysinibacillus sp. LK3]MCR6521916.1 LysR family transcriptional regulator [Lysinibacillus capsici]MCS5501415.1 LysR family transcriptional regulator [Lysinibacillus sp. A4]